jgi:hypothetical protein
MQSSRWSTDGVQVRKVGLYLFIERLMCLELCSEKSTGKSIKCLRIDDEAGSHPWNLEIIARELGSKGHAP